MLNKVLITADFRERPSGIPDLLLREDVELSLKNMKEIGIHPELGHKIYTLVAKFGPIVQMLDNNNKIVNTAPIKAPLKMNTITINDAVMFSSNLWYVSM